MLVSLRIEQEPRHDPHLNVCIDHALDRTRIHAAFVRFSPPNGCNSVADSTDACDTLENERVAGMLHPSVEFAWVIGHFSPAMCERPESVVQPPDYDRDSNDGNGRSSTISDALTSVRCTSIEDSPSSEHHPPTQPPPTPHNPYTPLNPPHKTSPDHKASSPPHYALSPADPDY
jgi:hypothetical protein